MDELGTEVLLEEDTEKAARRFGWHLVREELELL